MAATQKNFRMEETLRTEFESFCAENLLDEKDVFEAVLLHYMCVDDDAKKAIAKRYAQWKIDGRPSTRSVAGTITPTPTAKPILADAAKHRRDLKDAAKTVKNAPKKE